MVQRTGDQGQGNILFVQNNFYYDAFFLKAIGASIRCHAMPSMYVDGPLSSLERCMQQWDMPRKRWSGQVPCEFFTQIALLLRINC